MANQIVVKHRTGSTGEPSGLLAGEIASNIFDKQIFIGTGSGNLVFADKTYVDTNFVNSTALNSYQPLDADLTAIAALADTSGILKKTAADTWELDTSAYLTSYTEVNDLTSSVTWANVPDANITESSVTQHQAALSITESQISDLQAYLTTVSFSDLVDAGVQTSAESFSDDDTSLMTSAAIKQLIDSSIAGGVNYKGAYDANSNIPNLSTNPTLLKGEMYTVTTAGTFFGIELEVGDVLIAEIDNPILVTDWTIVQRNILNDQLIDGGTY